MKLMRYSSLLLALALAVVCVPSSDALQGPPGPPPPVPGYGPPPPPPRAGWDAPPGSYRSDIERRAYHEGIIGAQKDRQNGRRPDVNNRDEYMRRTAFPVPPNMLHSYRHAFRAGYDRGVQIYYGPHRY